MQESPVYQSILEKGIEQGERKRSIEYILELIDIRFQVRPTGTLNSAIESIDNLSRLKVLYRAALQVKSLEAFRHILENKDKSD